MQAFKETISGFLVVWGKQVLLRGRIEIFIADHTVNFSAINGSEILISDDDDSKQDITEVNVKFENFWPGRSVVFYK